VLCKAALLASLTTNEYVFVDFLAPNGNETAVAVGEMVAAAAGEILNCIGLQA
jgi:hypothetical protein